MLPKLVWFLRLLLAGSGLVLMATAAWVLMRLHLFLPLDRASLINLLAVSGVAFAGLVWHFHLPDPVRGPEVADPTGMAWWMGSATVVCWSLAAGLHYLS